VKAKLVSNDSELRAACELLRELRPAYSIESLVAAVREARESNGYDIAFVESGGDILCAAGFVITFKLAWGRNLYVDDLVTTETRRSEGAGSAMIEWLKSHARANDCRELHLDSGVQRFGAHRFYLRHGFDITSHHFAITDLNR
jgi:GNAT superfamily N-acetyltransferase